MQLLKNKNHPCKVLKDEEIKFFADWFLANKYVTFCKN